MRFFTQCNNSTLLTLYFYSTYDWTLVNRNIVFQNLTFSSTTTVITDNDSSVSSSPHMYTITREFNFCYGHRLLHYEGKCVHLHGHNGRVEITLASETLDECGMVLDFSELKYVVNNWLEENLDHKMVLAEDDPLVPVLASMQEPMFLIPYPPTAENFARLIFNLVKDRGYPVNKVVFWETDKCSATFFC